MAPNIKLESLSPNLIVKDVNRSVSFYTDFLGFTKVASVPEQGSLNWAMMVKDGVTIMFQTLHSIREDMPTLRVDDVGSLGTLFIKMKGLDDFYQSLRGLVEIAVDMRTTFYGMKEFVVRDIDGYFLCFAEDVA